MTQSASTVTWRSLTLDGSRPGTFRFSSLDGWEELPPTRRDSAPRPRSAGRFDAPVWADERTVTVTGWCYSATTRDALLAQIASNMTLAFDGGAPEALTINHAGRTLTARARLTRYKATMADTWAAGHFPFAVEWVCPDPFRYGTTVTTTTGFAQMLGGLEFDLFTNGTTDTGWLEFGSPGALTGLAVMANAGTAVAWPVFTVTGPVPSGGFDLVDSATGRRLRFTGAVPSGSTLTIDSATGLVALDGQDRLSSLTIRDWFSVAPGASTTVLFSPLGGPTAAVVSVAVTPTYW